MPSKKTRLARKVTACIGTINEADKEARDIANEKYQNIQKKYQELTQKYKDLEAVILPMFSYSH